jgi:DNA topoisomerase-3
MKTCIIAEKPSVARDISSIIGANQKQDGYLAGNGYTVTWAFGHLVTLAMPAEYGFEQYNADDLPILPEPFKLTVRQVRKGKEYIADPSALKQLKIIRTCFDQCERIIVATDAGREGELIFRYIFDYLQCKKPFERLWISSLTDKAIREGLEKLKNGSEYDNLYFSGKARSEADWLVGINASRALSLAAQKGGYSLGRVQTPTLSMICKRFIENKHFKSVPYWKIAIETQKDGVMLKVTHTKQYQTFAAAEIARLTMETCGMVCVEQIETKTIQQAPPLLYDLTALQKEANKKFSFSADQTLQLAQLLYEKKFITYPRTGSQYISEDVFNEIPELINRLQNHAQFGTYAKSLIGKNLNKCSVNTAKVTDHHALLPTENMAERLTQNETIIYKMIVARMLEAFSESFIKEQTSAHCIVGQSEAFIKGDKLLQFGWKAVLNERNDNDDEEITDNLPSLAEGENLPIYRLEITQHQTKPKPLYNEATLLSAMETAGKEVADEEAKAAMKECGLGTPATRAAIIETLIIRDYIVREKKSLIPTEKGLAVFEIVKDRKIADAEMTGSWEKALADIETGKMNAETFHKGIEVYTRQICKELLSLSFSNNSASLMDCPKCKTKNLIFYPKVAKCKECDFLVFREICGLLLSDEHLKALFTERKTPLLKGLTAKSGKEFNARLVLNADHTTSFAFEPNKKSDTKSNRKP